jgi:hypothetical protein
MHYLEEPVMPSKHCSSVNVDCLHVALSPCDSSARYPCSLVTYVTAQKGIALCGTNRLRKSDD